MKKTSLGFLFAIGMAAAAFTACSGNSKANAEEEQARADSLARVEEAMRADSIARADSMARADSIAKAEAEQKAVQEAQMKVVRDFYTTFFNNYDAAYAKAGKVCTKKLQQWLRNQNDYGEDDGYRMALWMFRTSAQDGTGKSGIVSVEPAEDNSVIISFKDMGHSGTKRIFLVEEGGEWKMDKIVTLSDKVRY